MFTTTANETLDEHRGTEAVEPQLPPNGLATNRLRVAFDVTRVERPGYETQPILVLLCFDPPDSEVGRFVSGIADALAHRQIAVHLL